MNKRALEKNKKLYLQYNTFRKKIFSELASKESEVILYMLPWLLSISHPSCPGYIPNSKKRFRVFNIDKENEIRRREQSFKQMFDVKQKESLLKSSSEICPILGLYTIGSVGTMSQTTLSDCDIWLCYDKREYTQENWIQLNQKVNLIKDWMDIHIKMPVFFFLSDVEDIRNNNFGRISSEGSGSAQKNVLKDEFYRSCIVICGKIPLWWICYDKNERIDYQQALKMLHKNPSIFHDIFDFGELQEVGNNEYFGAALWQLYKSLTRPFKSITKLIFLKILLDAPPKRQISYLFREKVLTSKNEVYFPDNSIFIMESILNYYHQKDKNIFDFFKECFYLRCEIKPYTKNSSIKKRMANDFFKRFPIDIKTRSRLSKFDTWNFNEQVNFSNHFFKLLLQIYQEIKTSHCGIINDINKQDLLVLGRKISVCFQKKEYKMLIVKKLRSTVNLPRLTFNLEGDEWNVFVGSDHDNSIIKSTNVIYNIAFIIWNDFFDSNKLFMIPNASNVTIQEIINLCIKMRNFFSHFDLSEIDHQYYIQKQHITKVMVVVSFEKSPWEKEFNDFCVIYCNSWGELFVRKFKNAKSLKNFLKPIHEKNIDIQMTFYLQRSCTSYEKIIERTKKIFLLDKQIYSTKPEDKKKMPVDIQPPIDYRLKKIQKHISKMPGLPATVTKVIEICDRPTTSPDALNRVISLDPVLTGYVLKLVNSAYYFMINKVTSLTRAIIMLGLNTVKNLVLSKSIVEIMGDKKSINAFSMDDFWSHSICVGVTAKSLASIKGISPTELEEYFLAGLLHDLGKIPLNNCFSEEYNRVIESVLNNQMFFYEAENSVFGLDHCAVGKMIAEKWKLNEAIKHSLSYHHFPDEAGEKSRKLVEIVALADSYANSIYSDSFEDSFNNNPSTASQLENVDIEWSVLSNLKETVESEIENAKAFLQPA